MRKRGTMRWSIIRLICWRDLQDQLRDRRTLFMIAVLPVFFYPVLGYAVLQFAVGFSERPSRIGIVRTAGGEFPERTPPTAGRSVPPVVSWLSATPNAGWAQLIGSAGLAHVSNNLHDFPPLILNGHLTVGVSLDEGDDALIRAAAAQLRHQVKIVAIDDSPELALSEKRVDLVLRAPPDFYARLEARGNQGVARPDITVLKRNADDHSEQAFTRLTPFLDSWKVRLKNVRLVREGLQTDFDEPFAVILPKTGGPTVVSDNLFDLFIRIFPFLLVLWSLAGALYPAVDLCAGEKERGTMETLLISPAAREEIVYGKFLTIWIFSAATALLNLASMGLTTWKFSAQIIHGSLSPAAIFWCVLLVLPLSAFFSAISLAIGAYARSSKEGQYYLMPLFVVTMPLVFLTLAPGVTLSPFYSLVPVTGAALLLQKLMTTSSLEQVPWLYFFPVFAPMAVYSWLALRWGVEQFQSEEVLFREAERLDIALWLRHLFRDKEALPTTGQAVFCFVLIITLRFLSLNYGQGLPSIVHTGISLLAFVATPVLFMAVVLNSQPLRGLSLRAPDPREAGVAAALALLLLPPLAALAQFIFAHFPALTELLEDRQPFFHELRGLIDPETGIEVSLWAYLLVFALLASVCEELAFRGYILTGLMRRFRPRTAILLSSFFFALFHMNVFQFAPAFILGIVLGLITVRAKSIWPAILFHFLHNSLLICSVFAVTFNASVRDWLAAIWPGVIAACTVVGLSVLWWLYRRPYVAVERRLALEKAHAQSIGSNQTAMPVVRVSE